MSNSLFENPKVALGFAGVVVAIALVASVALQEFSPSEEATQSDGSSEAQAQVAPANTQAAPAGFSSDAGSGWAGEGNVADDWGASSVAEQRDDFAGPSETPEGSSVFGERAARNVSAAGPSRSSGPKITTSVSPSAPPVRPPATGAAPQIQVEGG